MALSAASQRRIQRDMKRWDLLARLRAHATALEKTSTCDFDRQCAALFREAAAALEAKR